MPQYREALGPSCEEEHCYEEDLDAANCFGLSNFPVEGNKHYDDQDDLDRQ